MQPIQHKSSNDVLRPPAGASRDVCRPLYITRVLYGPAGDGGLSVPGVISYWQPTAEQLALLNQGHPVFLSCLGQTHPPVSLGVEGDGRLTD
jgi:hypothetical protein